MGVIIIQSCHTGVVFDSASSTGCGLSLCSLQNVLTLMTVGPRAAQPDACKYMTHMRDGAVEKFSELCNTRL